MPPPPVATIHPVTRMTSRTARRAAIDIGSNSIKLLVIDVDESGGYSISHDESRVTRLGRGLGEGGDLNPQSVADSLECLADYSRIITDLGAELAAVAATAALRIAADSGEFLAQVTERTGISGVRVISGAEEARLSRVIALRELPPGDGDVLFFDVGGGSTELTLCRGEEVLGECSLPIGARRLTEQAGVVHPVSHSMHDRLEAVLALQLADAPQPDPAAGQPRLAGLGGTATALLWVLHGLSGAERGDPHLARISLAAINSLLGELRPRTSARMRGLAYLDPARADVIYAGAVVIAAVLRHYGAAEFLLVDRGLRFGLLLAEH